MDEFGVEEWLGRWGRVKGKNGDQLIEAPLEDRRLDVEAEYGKWTTPVLGNEAGVVLDPKADGLFGVNTVTPRERPLNTDWMAKDADELERCQLPLPLIQQKQCSRVFETP